MAVAYTRYGSKVTLSDDRPLPAGFTTEPPQVEPADEPPRGGPGSGRDVWAGHLSDHGIDVDPDATRDDMIAAWVDRG